jgi:HlyD family secretion protein
MADNKQAPFWHRHRLMIIAAALIAVVLLASFNPFKRNEQLVRAAKAERGPIASTISTNGKIEPVNNFEAHAPAPTTVKRVLVHEGDSVVPGQLLLELDAANAQAEAARALAQLKSAQADLRAVQKGGTQEEILTSQAESTKAKAELEAAQRNLAAMQNLQKTGAASPSEVQAAQVRLDQAQAQARLQEQRQTKRFSSEEVARTEARMGEAQAAYLAAQDLLKNSNVRAPRRGLVYSLPVRPGVFVNTGDLLVQVADLQTVNVRAFVDEPDIGRLSRGQEVHVTWDALPGRAWTGKVTTVPTTVTLRGTRTVGEVMVEVNNQDLRLLPNVNVGVVVMTARNNDALSVPREAVHQDNGERFVYVVSDGALKRREVQTGLSNLTRIEITKGLQAGAVVALGTANNRPLVENAPARVVQP